MPRWSVLLLTYLSFICLGFAIYDHDYSAGCGWLSSAMADLAYYKLRKQTD